jgi:hypothetical protein
VAEHELRLDEFGNADPSELIDALELASDQDQMTWVLDAAGKRVAVIGTVDLGDMYERWLGSVLATPLQAPVSVLRRRIQDRLTEAGHPDMAALVPADPGILASYAGLLTDAEAGRKARTS